MVIRMAAALVLAATPAAAQTRPSSTAMTCQQTVRLIQARGALVLGTGGMTYDRFVRDRSFCEPTEIAKRAFRPTRDNPNCLIGYTCYEPGVGDWPGEDF
jgi:hypothetical protein